MTLLIRPEPFTRDVDRLFERLFDSQAGAQRWVPAMDLTEADDHYVLKADLPGMPEEDVSIEVDHSVLTLSGERQAEHERSERGWHRIERSFGQFQRQLTLPDGVEPDGVTAQFENGVLAVRIPKPERVKPRRIAIGAAGGNDQPAMEGTAAEK